VASFARAFRKAIGSAPGAYRKEFGHKVISPADFAAKDGSREKNLFEVGPHPKRRAPESKDPAPGGASSTHFVIVSYWQIMLKKSDGRARLQTFILRTSFLPCAAPVQTHHRKKVISL
jgi:hypothetical protein